LSNTIEQLKSATYKENIAFPNRDVHFINKLVCHQQLIVKLFHTS